MIAGTAPVGSIEYDALAILWGPDDMTGAGDVGPFLNALVGPVNAAIQVLPDWAQAQSFPPYIHDAAEAGTAPTSVQTVNVGLRQYFKIVNGVMAFTPYP